MRTKGKFNKGIASVLSAALLMGLTPAIPDMGIKSYAEVDTAKPSVQAYADVETLTSDIFTPKYKEDGSFDSDNTKLAKLKFGKKGNTAIEWYILGPDKNIAGEKKNIAIFAASNITTNCFYNDTSSHSYVGDDDEAYVTESEKPSSVCGNHYGESDIRSALRKMAGEEEDTSEGKVYDRYFTTTEKGMMQKTKVLTHEYSNKHLYTTNDKLYLASGDYNTNKIINVGSVSKEGDDYITAYEYTGIKLSCENYWNVGSWFWLRSPSPNFNSYELRAYPGSGFISHYIVYDSDGVRPASNLDLSSVLFASAVDTSSSDDEKGGIIETSGTNQAAMILRLDGSNENIGKFTFTYNKDGITVTKDTTASTAADTETDTEQDVFLVVQGKTSGTDGTDWYYSKKITDAEEIVPLDTIAAKTGIESSNIDLTSGNCKIWLETPVKDADKLCYAVTDGTKQHEHVYPTNKATPTELMKSDAGYHWWQCTAEGCLDLDGSIMNMTGEVGQKDAHNWVKSQEDADKDKTIFETCFKDKEKFLKDGTGNVEHKLNDEDNTKHDKITTYYYYCQDCKYVDKEHTFTYEEKEEHEYTKDNDGYTRQPNEHYKECLVCKHISDKGTHEYNTDNKCTDCGYEKDHKHDFVHVPEKEATCINTGNISYYYCKGCDLIYKDGISTVKITKEDTILPVTDHKAASYKSDSSKHWKICKTCKATFAEGAHNFSGNKCTECGYTKSSGGSSSGGSGGSKNSERYKTDSGSSSGSSGGASGANSTIAIINNNGSTSSWSKDESGRWWYYDTEHGNTKVIGWAYDKPAGKWYYVDESKGMLTGWVQDTADGYWYYLDNNTGEMLTGWQLIGGKQYYFAPASQAATYTFDEASCKWVYNNAANNRPYGAMYAGTTTPDNQRIDADGARIQ